MGHLERRITHQDIDSAEFCSGSINHRSTVSRIGQVTTHEYASATSVLNQPGDLSSVLILIEIGDQHVCAFACIRDGDRPADTAVAAGDHCTFTGQPARATVAILAAIWNRLIADCTPGTFCCCFGIPFIYLSSCRDCQRSMD
jgi:hypothetical protein